MTSRSISFAAVVMTALTLAAMCCTLEPARANGLPGSPENPVRPSSASISWQNPWDGQPTVTLDCSARGSMAERLRFRVSLPDSFRDRTPEESDMSLVVDWWPVDLESPDDDQLKRGGSVSLAKHPESFLVNYGNREGQFSGSVSILQKASGNHPAKVLWSAVRDGKPMAWRVTYQGHSYGVAADLSDVATLCGL